MTRDVEVLLIGGTSHVGKSSLAKRLAAARGWDHLSTDSFARHPGRPWRADRSRLPDDVIAYYSRKTVDEQMESVLQHYRENVWPIADAVVRSRLNNPYDRCLVLEGSALLPELVRASHFERSRCVWLTASDEVLTRRIAEESDLDRRSDAERQLIEAFIARTLAFDARIVDSSRALGERCLDVGSADVYDDLASLAKGDGPD